ncbi:very short patch repair endonuclease [Mycobacteroides abscessus]|uniref:very short patch repair endonuclease n=1 Tax=Mycobacteroides abscessus TaxID=36809 RepID=UPI000941D2EA|nr:very short patch repair endonuclease [Mycobacteroides abscessus]MDO3333022.1 very short patch repair endonuclease [Mycobacteroides abscessus subsp. bolletii]QSM89532.1 very short patch repair endonuclease [Mycobacteroides abscessus subsp. bolletii]
MTRDPQVTARIMAAVKNTGTRPELMLRRELHRRGMRYRVKSSLIGKPDIVFGPAHVACFVDGDRWHGNGWRLRGFDSFEGEFEHANSDFWKQKIRRNMDRDRDVNMQLVKAGWRVIRIWASEVERDVAKAADRVETVVRGHVQSGAM